CDFPLAPSDATSMATVIDASIAAFGAVGAPATWVLGNHDKPRPVTRYGGGDVGERRARAAALLMFSLPGGAYVYQGEELGLAEVEDLPEGVLQDPGWKQSGYTLRGRDGCRVPIPWSGKEPPFGFTLDGARAAPWLPQPPSWRMLTVQAQTGDGRSMLELYRRALQIRREHPALGDGVMRWVDAPGGALAFARDPGFVCIVNMT